MHSLNAILSRRAESVQARLKEAISELKTARERHNQRAGGGSGAGEGAAGPCALSISAALKAGLSVSLMLIIKSYLRMAYDVPLDRVAQYEPIAAMRRQEEKLPAVHNGKHAYTVHFINSVIALAATPLPRNASTIYYAHAAASLAAGGGSSAAGLDGQASGAMQMQIDGADGGDADGEAGAGPGARVGAAGGRSGGGGSGVSVGACGPLFEVSGLSEAYKTLKMLMKNDEADYK